MNEITNAFISAIFGTEAAAFCVTLDNGWSATYTTAEIARAVLHDLNKPGTVIDLSTGELIDYID